MSGQVVRATKSEVNNVKRSALKMLCASALAALAVGAQASPQIFKDDVNAAIDAGLAYTRAAGHLTNPDHQATGLSLLTLLEKESIPAGYNGLSAADKVLAQNAACLLITSGYYGDRGGFYSYYDGQVLMGLSVYLDTGGPDQPLPSSGPTCPGRSARQTIDKVVDRSLAAQTQGVPSLGQAPGYWGYAGTGYDSSTTQFTLAGLSAAKGFYSGKGESSDKNRIPLIRAALKLTSAAYAVNGKTESCASGDCTGHGYQSYYGAGNSSSQQTASGTWGQLAGDDASDKAKNVNDPAIQSYLRWLQDKYSYTTNIRTDQWPPAYFYYLWSSSKAYNIIQNSGVAATGGNIDPAAMGTLIAVAGRQANRVPDNDARPAPRGGSLLDNYKGAAPGWYYDYAYQLMSLQSATGQFPNPNGSFGYPASDHAYAILVLQRSLGGACVDTDGDGVCDSVDNCTGVSNPNQANTYGDARGDACEPRPLVSCDLDTDGDVDSVDVKLITALRNKPASVNRKADIDGNGIININDARACVLKCTRLNCATQ